MVFCLWNTNLYPFETADGQNLGEGQGVFGAVDAQATGQAQSEDISSLALRYDP